MAPWPPAAAARVERDELCQVDEPVAVRVQLMEGLRDRGSERHGCVIGRHGAHARFSFFPIPMVFSSLHGARAQVPGEERRWHGVRKIAHSKGILAPSLVGDRPSRQRATAARTTRGCAVPSPASTRSRRRRNNNQRLCSLSSLNCVF